MNWLPVGLVAAVVGGLAFLRMETTKVKVGDYVVVDPNSFTLPIALPVAPLNARALVRVDQIAPDGSISVGYVVGYIEPQTNTPTLPGAGAAGLPVPQIRKDWILGLYRGVPPIRIA